MRGFVNGKKHKAKSHHYHCVLFVDGDKVRHPIEIIKAVKAKWFKFGNVPDKFLKNFYYNLRKENYKETRDAIIWRLSYYGKVRGKGYRNAQSSDYQTSRLKLNNSLHIHSKKNNNKKNYKKTQ